MKLSLEPTAVIRHTQDKPPPNNHAHLPWALMAQARNRISLSPRQRDVLMAVCAGHPNKVIARLLHISEKTVKAHLSAIFLQLNVKNRTQAALVARQLQLVPEPGLHETTGMSLTGAPVPAFDSERWL